MPQVILAVSKGGQHDGSVEKQTMKFLYKLHTNDTQPGLHIEPIHGSIDPRVRTGRVNDMYRAVLFKVQGSGHEAHYIFTGVWPHDEAISIASKAQLKVNPVHGTTEMLLASEEALAVRPTIGTAPATIHARVAEASSETGSAHEFPILESVSVGTTLERLVDVLGIEPALAERAVTATSDEAIMDLAMGAVEWQGLALLDLAAGKTIADVKESLGLGEKRLEVAEQDEDTQLLAGLRTPAARMQFAWIEDDEELRQVIEGGDFAKWRVFLHPEQRKYVESSWKGSFRLSGGAGTGKTVVLLHRARMLARRNPEARVILTTFTRNLADGLRRDLQLLDPTVRLAKSLGDRGVFITGVDAAASAVLSSAVPDALAAAVENVLGGGGNPANRRPSNTSSGWREALQATGHALQAELRSERFFEAEYAAVVLPNRVRTRDEFLRVRRPGRGVALNRSQRDGVWTVISSYRSSKAIEGVVDFGEVTAIAAELLNDGRGIRPGDHVLVDEGQDLTASQWQFLRALVAEGPDDLFIAEDSQQRIYGQRVVLARLGIKIVGRSRRLSLNYRTTQQVLSFATRVLEGVTSVDITDEDVDTAGFRSARKGPAPERIGATSLTQELDKAADQVRAWRDSGVTPEAIGILVRDQRTADQVSRGLEDRGVDLRHVTRQAATANVPQLMTMHRAKGMEFQCVLIFGVDAELVPAAYLVRSVPEGDRPDLLQRERSLFYVAATRARDQLVVMWVGDASEFLPPGSDRSCGEAPRQRRRGVERA